MALLPIGFWLQGVEVIAAIDADTKIKEQALAAKNMVSFLGFGNQEPQKEGQKARNANLLYLAEEFAKARGILTIPWWSTSFLQSFGEELVQATQEMEEKRVWVFIYPTTRYFSKLPVDAFVYDSENIPHLPEVLKKKGELAVNLAVRVFNKAKERWRSEKAILREHVEALELQGAEQFTLNYPELASQAGALVQCSLKNSNIDQALQQTIGLQGALSVMGELFTLNEFKNLLEKKGVILSGKYLSSIDCWAKQVENYRAEQTTPTPQEELTKVSSACPEQGQQMVAKLKELLKQDQDGADGYVKNWSPEQIELFISCAADDEELEEIMRSLLLQGQKFPCLDEGC